MQASSSPGWQATSRPRWSPLCSRLCKTRSKLTPSNVFLSQVLLHAFIASAILAAPSRRPECMQKTISRKGCTIMMTSSHTVVLQLLLWQSKAREELSTMSWRQSASSCSWKQLVVYCAMLGHPQICTALPCPACLCTHSSCTFFSPLCMDVPCWVHCKPYTLNPGFFLCVYGLPRSQPWRHPD